MESYDLDQHEEDLTLLLHAWPDIEQAILREAEEPHGREERSVADALRRAFRVEVQAKASGLYYVILFDVNDYEARQAAAVIVTERYSVERLADKHAPTQGRRWGTDVRVVPSGKPSRERCARA